MAQAKKATTKATTKKVIKPNVKTETEEVKTKAKKVTAKAGKRSPKALQEAEVQQTKQDKKIEAKQQVVTPTPPKAKTVAHTKLERRSKSYRQAMSLIEPNKLYSLDEASLLIPKTSTLKFDASIEMHINLAVDPKQADQNVRDNLVLPSGSGKTVRVAVMAEAEDAIAAKTAGADISNSEEVLKALEKGNLEFDILIATPALMAKLGKYARTLGPRGLMPNPKSGTVTTDVARAVKEAKSGRVEYRVDSTGIVHLAIGKVSFSPAQLLENAKAVLSSIRSNKPASVKGTYIKALYLTTTMGPSIKIDLASIL
ncbi:MAG TPA: 50S ribosomal protein L1 [Candidatus Dormibacteraeota bacterium]|nr:50S ribosomal protein L1 [Candidatus Dormibacteraeota bacterium]